MQEPHEPIPVSVDQKEAIGAVREASVQVAGYLEGYSLFRHESDKPHDRLPEINRISNTFPLLADKITTLDAQVERGLEFEKDFKPARTPTHALGSGFPADYTFASVRSPSARRLLNILNLSELDENQMINGQVRSDALRNNGVRLYNELFGADGHLALRATSVGVVEAVLSGKVRITASPRLPERDPEPAVEL